MSRTLWSIIGSVPSSLGARMASSFAGCGHGGALELHHQHDVGQPVARLSAKPGDFPIAEARANGDRRAKVQELGLQLHGVDLRSGGGHSQVEIRFRQIEQFTWLLVGTEQ